ncbi:MAG: immunity 49 family protein [Aureispira sp.]|nr:immunity 49 family protein [Aureispira sp.]
MRRGRDYGIGNFIYGSNPGVEFEFAIEDSLHTIVGANVTAYMHTNLWFKTFFSCLITRASKARAELCKTPTSVFQNANIKPNAYDLAYVDLLKGLFDSEANLSQIFKNISDTSDPEVLEVERQDFIYDIMNPTMLLLYHMLRNDENAFNEQLENALNSHKEFWSNNADDSYGWISLPILAACSLAIDNKDFSITVESEYIPKWLYEKDF